MKEYKINGLLSSCTCNKDFRKAIKIYDNKGFALVNPLPVRPKQNHDNIAKRGKVGGWSRDSRRRFRRFLMTNRFPSGWYCFGVTLTIPGYPLTVKENKKLFNTFSKYCQRMQIDFACAWRLEIQKRGSLHWHLIAGSSCSDSEIITDELKTCWIKCLKTLGEVEHHYIGSLKNPTCLDDLHALNGINNKPPATFDYWETWGNHYKEWIETGYTKQGEVYPIHHENSIDKKACDITIFETQTYGNWLRYMHDHATKSKQEQIAHGFGRHWGVINKKAFVSDTANTVYFEDNPEDYFKILRWLNRLFTPVIKDSTKIFGRRKGEHWKSLTKNGEANYFSSPETIKRMIDYLQGDLCSLKQYGDFSEKSCNSLKIHKKFINDNGKYKSVVK